MRILSFLAVTLLVVSGVVSVAVAEDGKASAPWSESCRHYRSARHFVNESTIYCLRRHDQKECQGRAHKYFEQCRFQGDFQKMSARMSARMLLVLALSSVRSVHQLDL
jgi:hypothetical protein